MNISLLDGEIEEYREAREFWLAMLKQHHRAATIAPERIRGDGKAHVRNERRLNLSFPDSLSDQLLSYSSRKESLLFAILLSGLAVTVAKLCSERTVYMACPVLADLAGVQSPNRYLPIGREVTGEETVKELWKQMNQTIAAAYRYHYYPLGHVYDALGTEHSRMCHVACELAGMHDSYALQACRSEGLNGFSFAFRTTDEKVAGELIYDAGVYAEHTARAIAESFLHVLGQMAEKPDSRVGSFPIADKRVQERLLREFHPYRGNYPKGSTIHGLFEDQASLTPDRTALVCGDARMTYAELNRTADAFARRLARYGEGLGRIVGVVMDRTPEPIVAMLGVLKAGASYMPIDPDYPHERIRYMVEDSGTACVAVSSRYAKRIPFKGNVLVIDAEAGDAHSERDTDESVTTAPKADEEDLAYVIYTSGSTGSPKGVMVGHRGMANLHAWFRSGLCIKETDRIVQFASASFDASVWEMFMAFFNGAELHLVDKDTIGSYEAFTRFVQRSGITVATLPPTYAAHLDPSRMPMLRLLITAGSASSQELADRWRKQTVYMNAYGPTEATICASVWSAGSPDSRAGVDSPAASTVPIGKPILNTDIYIVNNEHHLLPVGFAGELCIGGVSLARGYLGREALTAERFVENPFASGERMYKTGDYARWLPDGNIEFIGRIDHQVKVRGYRIETGEIEYQLLRHPAIGEAFVKAAHDRDGEASLIAYYVSDMPCRASEVKQWLAERLPAYMLPQHLIAIQALPLTANGKVDSSALPAPGEDDAHTGPDAAEDPAANAIERKLAAMWRANLGIASVSLTDHYFDRGGHSLKAAELITVIHKQFQVQLTLRELMENPTLQAMAKAIDNGMSSRTLPAIKPVYSKPYYPLSLAQRRLFVLNRCEPESLAYNLPVALRLTGPVERARLEQAFAELVRRHESLRTSFALREGMPVQIVHEETVFIPTFKSIREEEVERELQSFIRPFDFNQAPLLRAELLQIADERYVLCIDMHHIISDGVSMSVFIEDLLALYQGEDLTPLRLQYKDFACWQQEMLETDQLADQEAYWLSAFATLPPPLRLRTDYPRQASILHWDKAAAIRTVLSSELSGKLRRLASETGSTLYMVFVSALSALLSMYTGQRDIVIGTPVAGRGQEVLEPLIGMFVQMLPIRSFPDSQKPFRELLSEVRETALSSFENQDYPFDELVRKLNVEREADRNPLFDVSFAMQNIDTSIPSVDGLRIEPVDLNFHRAKFDLTLWAEEAEGRIALLLEYRTHSFKRESAERMLHDMSRLVEQISETPEIKLGEIDLRTEEERLEQKRKEHELERALEMEFDL